jgi:hypothetical protein
MNEATSGKAVVGVVLVLLVAAGAGNYFRNYRAEQQVFRPYRNYTEDQLLQLVKAYEANLESLSTRYGAVKGQRAEVKSGPLLGERVRAFESAQRAGERVRALGHEASKREAALRDFQAEVEYREAEKHRLRVFLRRLFTVSL